LARRPATNGPGAACPAQPWPASSPVRQLGREQRRIMATAWPTRAAGGGGAPRRPPRAWRWCAGAILRLRVAQGLPESDSGGGRFGGSRDSGAGALWRPVDDGPYTKAMGAVKARGGEEKHGGKRRRMGAHRLIKLGEDTERRENSTQRRGKKKKMARGGGSGFLGARSERGSRGGEALVRATELPG
jgi:hypothetical protein